MRLGFAVFRRRGGAVFHFASEFDGFGPIPVISPRLRRILEQPSGNPPEKPETQTHFGPPGGTAARWRASPRSQWRWRGQGRRRGPSPSEAQARCGLPTWEPPCVSKSVRARGRRGSLETQPLLSPRFRPSSLLGALPSLVSHTRAGIRKHNGGIKPLCATTCCVNPALVCAIRRGSGSVPAHFPPHYGSHPALARTTPGLVRVVRQPTGIRRDPRRISHSGGRVGRASGGEDPKRPFDLAALLLHARVAQRRVGAGLPGVALGRAPVPDAPAVEDREGHGFLP